MITITNKTILDYLVRKIIKEKRATPKYIQIDECGLRIVWRNSKVTTRNIFSRVRIDSFSMRMLLVDFHGVEIAEIDYVITEIIGDETERF